MWRQSYNLLSNYTNFLVPVFDNLMILFKFAGVSENRCEEGSRPFSEQGSRTN